uniref:USP domain-containing protein n=1 Tax=Parascaris univalens TaxID=6257 RepID=A0A915A378_PARUN
MRMRHLLGECSSLAGNVDRLMLKEVVSAVDHGRFSQGLQEDACEFLLELLKQLEDEHRRAFEVVKNDGDYEHLRDEVTNIFVFELEHTIICYRCGEERRQTENDCLLPLPLPPFSRGKRNRESVQSLIMRCLRSECVEHICSICHSERAIVQHSFTKLPKCLIVVLKRYEYNVQLANTSKRTDEVAIPLRIRLYEGKVASVTRFIREPGRIDEVVAETPTLPASKLQYSSEVVMRTLPEMIGHLQGNQKVKYCSMEALLHMERDQSTTNVRTQSHHAMKSDSGSEGKQELVTVVDGNSNDFFMNLSFDTMALVSFFSPIFVWTPFTALNV